MSASGIPYLADVVNVKANRGFTLQYKTTYNDDESYKEMDFLLKKYINKDFVILKTISDPKGFSKDKKLHKSKLSIK